ncbi:smoothened homolog [Trichonephila clavata]|uniref:Smoothened homolog n=1 Tax=Trichonephila clavata TaxID=2740835 RepID=A0A8X6FAC9_TRICU|nr:smoothened homolog [Trichonephila clavata]
MLAYKSGSKDVFDPGVCFQEATCLQAQNNQNLTCFGTELPYSSTSLDLAEDSESLLEVQDNLALWQGLRSIPRCWAVVQTFLCAVYMPKCENGSVSLPSQEMCRITRGPCKAVKVKHSWPSFLQCENKKLYPPRCRNPLQEIKFNTSYKCIPPLKETVNAENWFDDVDGCGIQCQDPFYTEKEHDSIHTLIAFLGGISFITTMTTVMTFCLSSKGAKQYPAAIIFLINLCLAFVSLGWLIQFFPGARDEIVCFHDGTIRRQQPKSAQHLCTFTFFIIYYFLMAAIVWFVTLSYALYIQFRKTGSAKDILKKKATLFHICAWCTPGVFTSIILAIKEVDGDSMSGICFVGFANPTSRIWFLLIPVALAALASGFFLISLLYTLLKMRGQELANEKSRVKLHRMIRKISMFSICAAILIICTFACHAYDFINRKDWMESLRDYIVCQAMNSAQPSSEFSVPICSLKNRPNISVMYFHVACMFAFGVLMSSWAWTKTSLNVWKRFFHRCCASKEESANLKKHELIAKAFQKRHQLNQGHISLSLNSHNEDPIGMNLDGSSLASGDISSSWAMALPYFISRRNAITDLMPFTPRHYSSASDISRHVSLDSYNQQNLDSASLQISEQEYVLRHQRRKTRKERMRLWKTNRWFPSTRRGSDTSLQSSLTASIVAAAKSSGAKVSKSTSTGDLVPSPVPVYPPCLLPPVIPQPNKRSAIPREVVNPPFTHGMTDNSHRLECRNLSSIGTPSSSQRITPNPMNIDFHNPMNRFAPPPLYGQGFDVLNSLSFGLMGGVMYPTINGIYNEYPFNHAPYSSMIYATCGSYQNSNTTLNHIHPSELPMQPRIESSSETEYFPIIMSDSEFTDTGHRSYDEAQLMTTHRLMRERAQALAAAAAAGNQLDPSQPKAVLEPQACAKTEFLKRLDLCNPKPLTTAAPPSRPPTTDRRSPHSEAPPPSPADSVKSISVDYEDDDVFECSINDAKETSMTSNVEEPEDESLLQKLKSKFQSAISVSRTNLEQSENIELSSKPCCEFSATGNDTTSLKNSSKEKCLDPSESVSLMQTKDGNENVSR